jgi:D-alanine-D-alanine ligase
MPVSPQAVIVYNEPTDDRYTILGEEKAIQGVLDEVKAVDQALVRLGYTVQRIPLLPPLEKVEDTLRQIKTDIVFNLFEGFAGRPETEAVVADFLAELGFAYTGCPGNVLSIALDKSKTKEILQHGGLATPAYRVMTPETISVDGLNFPCIVKPVAEDASHGMSIESVVVDYTALEKQVKHISEQYDGRALVEEYIDGRELNATVLGNENPVVLPIAEIVYTLPEGMPRILTFEAKWEPKTLYFKSSAPLCPAVIDEEAKQRISTAALKAFILLKCRGYVRVDFRMSKDGIPYIIEVNPNPDLSPGYGAARQARTAGMSYPQLIERIIQLALERKKVMPVTKPPMGPATRPMTATDKPAVMEILRHTSEFKPMEVEVAEELIDSYLSDGVNSGYFHLVGEVDTQVAGYICYGPTPITTGTWDVYWMAVSLQTQRHGVGKALLATTEADIKKQKGRLILIETSSKPNYEKAQRFYTKQGYDMISRIADFYEPGDDKLTYLKRL